MSRPAIEDLYPLSPVQRGLFARELIDAGRGHYVVQFVATLGGTLDVDAFREAWATVQARHAVLRSSFVWQRVEQPLQVVHRDVPLPFALETAPGPRWLEEFLERQRARGFALGRAPLFSVTLARAGDELHHCVWCYHHLLLDGWSSALVLREVFAAYAALTAGTPSRLAAPVPYSTYLDWLRGQDLGPAERFWRAELEGAETVPVRTTGTLPRPATELFRVPDDLQRRLTRFLRLHRLTPATLVHAWWALLLASRTGSSEVIFGSVVSGRPPALPGADAIVGPLLSVLPVRVRIPAEEPLGDWLVHLQRRLLELQQYGAVSVGQIESWAGVPSGSALFQSILTVENYPHRFWSQGEHPGAALRASDVRFVESTDYPLTVEAVPAGNLVLQLLYDRRRFPAASIAALLEEGRLVLERLLAEPAPRPRAWPSAARSRPGVEPAAGDTLVARWLKSASEHASRTALECGETRLTYRDLRARTGRLASRLREEGVGAEEPVVVFCDRSIELVVAILAILEAGAAYVPIEPGTPDERLASQLRDTRARLAVTVESLAPELTANFTGRLVSVDAEVGRAGPASCDDPSPVHPDQAAYVIYTSGSAGRPKGVVVSHRNVVRLFDATRHLFGFGPDDAWTLFHSYAFDFSVWELFGALLHGGRLVVVPHLVSRSPADFLTLLRERRITVLNQTPSAFRMLMAEDVRNPAMDLALRLVVFGGEALPVATLSAWFRRHGGHPALVNMYGITETTVHVTYRAIDAIDAEFATGHPIGGPLPDLAVHLLDPSGEPVADGDPGEIHVGGPGLARGYLGDPALTARRFVPDPFSCEPGARLYRSGDRARRLPTGEFEFLGRVDRQVKSRGFRIELPEIEDALRSHPALEDAVVIQRPEGDAALIAAYVVPDMDAAGPVRRLIGVTDVPPGSALFELPASVTVIQKNRAETEFMIDEIVRSSSYLRHGIELEAGDCIVDAGANIGLFGLFAHLDRPDLRIYAFEPMPETYRLLEANFKAHGVAGRTFNCALGSEAGVSEFSYYPHVSVLSGRSAGAFDRRGAVRDFLRRARGAEDDSGLLEELLSDRLTSEHVTSPVERLSTVLRANAIETVDLLKIDVEGDECEVLAGIDEPDWAKIRQLVIEVHDPASCRRIESQLCARGYRVTLEQQDDLEGTALTMIYAAGRVRSRGAGAPAPRRPVGPVWRSVTGLADDVRRHLARRLPEYMLPHSLSLIDRIPLTANGKLDAQALQAIAGASRPVAPRTEPRTPREATLARIWREQLGLDEIDVNTSFFELGGDSVHCIQMVSRARAAGLLLTPSQVFEHKTIARLAGLASEMAPPAPAATVAATTTVAPGATPLTPIQRWFFELRVPDRNHWNQAVAVELDEAVPVAVLQQALEAVVGHHDAFRARFTLEADRPIRQRYADAAGPVPLTSSRADDEAAALAELHQGLDLEQGPLVRALLVEAAPGRRARLVLAAHHLVVDMVSWRILFEDLAAAIRQIAGGQIVRLPPVATTHRQWVEWAARRLPASPGPSDSGARPPRVPRDFNGTEPPTEATGGEVAVFLSRRETEQLLNDVTASTRMSVEAIVLAGATFALARWTGSPLVRLAVERHGRPVELETSRTVGWFTTFHDVQLDAGELSDPVRFLRSVKESLLRSSLCDERDLGQQAPAVGIEVSFNFLGTLGGAARRAGPFHLLAEAAGRLHDPRGRRPFVLGIEAAVVDGRLRVSWFHSTRLHRRATAEALGQDCLKALRGIILTSRYVDVEAVSPLDFPLADLTPAELQSLVAADPKPEDVYRLTPAQQGLLFHALYDPHSPVYFTQFHWVFKGELDAEAYERAWRAVVARHPILRTAFVHRGLREPHQIVHGAAGVHLELEREDWRGRRDEDLDAAWSALLARHRARSFDPASAPLMRLALVRTRDDEHRFLWNHHHLLIDGWCTGIILRDVFVAYEAVCRGAEPSAALPPPPRRFRDYVAWLGGRDSGRAETFWREYLGGHDPAPTFRIGPDPLHPADPSGETDAIVHRPLGRALDARLADFARARGLTLNTIVMGAWAVLLSRHLDTADVVFGSTVSGRPSDLEGADQMVGLFINTLPVRARLRPDAAVMDWLAELQRAQAAAREFEHVALSDIRRWSGIDPRRPLFETVIVFENLPEVSVGRRSVPGLAITDVGSFVRNHFPFTVRAVPGRPLSLDALIDPSRYSREAASRVLADLESILAHLVGRPAASLGSLTWARAASRAPDFEREPLRLDELEPLPEN